MDALSVTQSSPYLHLHYYPSQLFFGAGVSFYLSTKIRKFKCKPTLITENRKKLKCNETIDNGGSMVDHKSNNQSQRSVGTSP